ncbi:hypothetical protein [Streptosporangium subroseum]|nr:hypothetical protein OHB15_24730 [Streptosporangium subroseum]
MAGIGFITRSAVPMPKHWSWDRCFTTGELGLAEQRGRHVLSATPSTVGE